MPNNSDTHHPKHPQNPTSKDSSTDQPFDRDAAELSTIRTDYSNQTLTKASVPSNPLDLFRSIWSLTLDKNLHTPNACTLATATSTGIPSARIVLLREFSEADGFIFYTNYQSRKGQELIENPHASMLFFWPELETQVRLEGAVTKTADHISDSYFATRPKESQIGAWASPQSQAIENREELDQRFASSENQLQPSPSIPRPEFWGGFSLHPTAIEFWKGRPNRLHDRILYQKVNDSDAWKISRLAP